MSETNLSPEQIAAHLQAALTEVRACLPGKERAVSVGAREFTAGDVLELCRQKKVLESAVESIKRFAETAGSRAIYNMAHDALERAKEK